MMKRLVKKSELTIRDKMIDCHSGQTDSVLVAYEDGKQVGTLEYTVYKDSPSISMINVPEARRKGVATALLKKLQQMYPDVEISWGMMTGDGLALKDSVTYEVEDTENAPLFKELETLKSELEELENKIDIGEDVGDKWHDTYDRIRDLEKELYDKKPTKTLIK